MKPPELSAMCKKQIYLWYMKPFCDLHESKFRSSQISFSRVVHPISLQYCSSIFTIIAIKLFYLFMLYVMQERSHTVFLYTTMREMADLYNICTYALHEFGYKRLFHIGTHTVQSKEGINKCSDADWQKINKKLYN